MVRTRADNELSKEYVFSEKKIPPGYHLVVNLFVRSIHVRGAGSLGVTATFFSSAHRPPRWTPWFQDCRCKQRSQFVKTFRPFPCESIILSTSGLRLRTVLGLGENCSCIPNAIFHVRIDKNWEKICIIYIGAESANCPPVHLVEDVLYSYLFRLQLAVWPRT